MNESWFHEPDKPLSDINVTPLVDVALVLLIVFMITAPMMVQGAEVRLPRTERMDALPQDQILITVNDEGEVRVNADVVPIEELEAFISPRVTPGRTILVYGDERGTYGRVVQVLAIIHRLGGNVGLVTEPIPER